MAINTQQAKHHLRVTNSLEDDYISGLIDLAVDYTTSRIMATTPESLVDQATLLLTAFYYAHRGDPTDDHQPPTPNAWRSSGASALLAQWVVTGSSVV